MTAAKTPFLSAGTGLRELVSDLYLITLLLVFPLFPGFSGYTNITLSKYVFLLAAAGTYFVSLVLVSVLRPEKLPRPGAPQWAALAFLAAALLSWLCSPWRAESFLGAGRYDGLLSLAVYALSFLAVSLFTRPKPLHFLALGAAVTLCCVVALLQLAGRNPLGLFPGDLTYYDSGVRYSGAYLGTIGNTNILDAVLCLAVPLFAVAAARVRALRCLALPLALALAVLALAGGDGAYFALACTGLAALVFLPHTARGRLRGLCAVLALAAAAICAVRLWPGESGTLYELRCVLRGELRDSFGSSRVLIWRECLALVPARPLLGGGPGTLPLRLDLRFSRTVESTGKLLSTYVDNAHSLYLGYLTNLGAAGLAAYLALLAAAAASAWKRRGPLSDALALGVFCAAVHGFFGLGLVLSEPVFWAALGLLCTVKCR